MVNDPNRLFIIGTDIVKEFFPGTYKWPELYMIVLGNIERTKEQLIGRMKQIIKDGTYKDVEAAGMFLYAGLDEEAAKRFEENKDTFPLKTVLKRDPSHVKDFYRKCIDVGCDEFIRGIDCAIDFVYCKQEVLTNG